MSNENIKLFVPPKFKPKQYSLYTPLTNKPQIRKPISLFTWNTMIGEIKNELTDDESDILFDIFDEADKEDLNGKLYDKEENFKDSILNENEQKNFLQILKEKQPKIYEVVNRFIKKLQSKSDVEKVADNFNMKLFEDPFVLGLVDNYYNYCIEDLNTENLLSVLSKYKNGTLLSDIWLDANERANTDIPEFDINEWFCEDEELTEEKIQYATQKFEEYKNEVLVAKENGVKDIERIHAKCIDFAGYLLKIAEKNNIYSKDYEEAIEKAIENNDTKNLTIATQRLADRITIMTDKDKTLNASKRAIELKEANGQIDTTFIQGYTGDCWFLSALDSMCSDKDVLERINKMITVNKEGDEIKSVTVNIQGKDYTFDYKHIKSANEYATGDLDVRALELAVNQYMQENNIISGDISLGAPVEEAYKILFGENVEIINYLEEKEGSNSIEDFFANSFKKFNPNEYINALKESTNSKIISNVHIAAYNSHQDKQKKYYAMDKNGEQVELKFQHSYKYSKIDNEFYYFTNPHEPEKELHISLEDFSEIFDGGVTVKFK